MNEREQQGRPPAEVSRYLHGMDFPANRDAVIRHARRQDVDDEFLDLLGCIPNRDYGSTADVMKGLGERH